ncbi:MAG: hypothetical protein K2X87_22245, partial [Gemmataceae bacterium]|nr:hypothetical protein [Gemmataceae bacterium]
RRLAAEARVCPRCLAAGRLVRRKAQAASPQYPEVRYLECTAEGRDPAGNPVVCGYQFRASYAKLPRVCFPTVGVRASGKTQLLVTAYDRVRNGSVPTAAAVQRAPSLADKRFEKYVDEILVAHRSPDFTPHTLPYPINLHVRDTDPTGPSTVLVNLFDYAGQMMNTTVDHDALRQRAVRMDGFLLFLDPTQLYGDTVHLPGGGTLRNLSLASQVKALDDYFEDMREERGVPEGRPIPLPVAVCVTKLDLLVSENPIGGDSVPYSRELTAGGLDPGPEGPLTLDALTRRSGLVEEMFPQMFPGLNLRKKLHDYFGDQVLFFPVSSVGLVEDELGVRDLKRRTIAPYGVVEPVLWPLHMHGYQVFAG